VVLLVGRANLAGEVARAAPGVKDVANGLEIVPE
jgi:hypothetical protein